MFSGVEKTSPTCTFFPSFFVDIRRNSTYFIFTTLKVYSTAIPNNPRLTLAAATISAAEIPP